MQRVIPTATLFNCSDLVGKVIYLKEYNESTYNNRLNRKVKAGDPAAIEEMSNDLIKKFAVMSMAGVTLIPTPSRNGFAENMLTICNNIATAVGCKVADVVKGNKRISNYDAKLQGKCLTDQDFGFYLEPCEIEGKLIIIDNVIGTGATVGSILKLLPSADVFVHSVDERVFNRSLKIVK